MGTQQFNEGDPVNTMSAITSATALLAQQVWNIVQAKSRVDVFILSNDDAIDHVVRINYVISGSPLPIGSVLVPAGSGYGALAPVDVLKALLPLTQQGIAMNAFDYLSCQLEVVMGSTAELTAFLMGGTL
jgi:hypothetical protein